MFNTSSCCPVCRKTPREKSACSSSQFKTCISAARECASYEVPVVENGQCCKSCRRVQRKSRCFPYVVAQCMANLRECDRDQAPASLQGSCCPSCKPRPTLCGEDCETPNTVCARQPEDRARCWPPVNLIYIFGGQNAAANLTRSEHLEMILEIAIRYCEREEHKVACDAFLPALTDGLQIPRGRILHEQVKRLPRNFSLELVVPEIPIPDTLAKDENMVWFLQSLLKDGEASGGLKMYGAPPDKENSADPKEHSVLLLVALLSLLVLVH